MRVKAAVTPGNIQEEPTHAQPLRFTPTGSVPCPGCSDLTKRRRIKTPLGLLRESGAVPGSAVAEEEKEEGGGGGDMLYTPPAFPFACVCRWGGSGLQAEAAGGAEGGRARGASTELPLTLMCSHPP